MINNQIINKLCCEDISLIENYEKAILDTTQTWHCHHRKETDLNVSKQELIDKNLYFNRPASELIFLTARDHFVLHKNGHKMSEEAKEKNRQSHLGKVVSIETRQKISIAHKGKRLSEETKRRMSDAKKGIIPWNKGLTGVFHHTEESKKKIREAHTKKKSL